MSIFVAYIDDDQKVGESILEALTAYKIKAQNREQLVEAGVTDPARAASDWFDVFLVVWTRRAAKSYMLEEEMEEAIETLRIVTVDDTPVPDRYRNHVLAERFSSSGNNGESLASLLRRYARLRTDELEVDDRDFSLRAAATLMAGPNGNVDEAMRELISGQNVDILFGTWTVKPYSGEIKNDDDHRILTRKSMAVLMAILQKQGRPISKQELLDTVWKGRYVVDNVVHQRITEVRKVLGDLSDTPQYIETLPQGYRAVASIRIPAGAISS